MTGRNRGNADLASILLGLLFLVVTLVCGLILMRFLLLLVGADRGAGSFGLMIVNRSEAFVSPFLSLVGATSPKFGAVFEYASLLAVTVYGVGALIVVGLTRALLAPRKSVGYTYNVGKEPRPRRSNT